MITFGTAIVLSERFADHLHLDRAGKTALTAALNQRVANNGHNDVIQFDIEDRFNQRFFTTQQLTVTPNETKPPSIRLVPHYLTSTPNPALNGKVVVCPQELKTLKNPTLPWPQKLASLLTIFTQLSIPPSSEIKFQLQPTLRNHKILTKIE